MVVGNRQDIITEILGASEQFLGREAAIAVIRMRVQFDCIIIHFNSPPGSLI